MIKLKIFSFASVRCCGGSTVSLVICLSMPGHNNEEHPESRMAGAFQGQIKTSTPIPIVEELREGELKIV